MQRKYGPRNKNKNIYARMPLNVSVLYPQTKLYLSKPKVCHIVEKNELDVQASIYELVSEFFFSNIV